MAELDEVDIEHLISLVSQTPCIWDKSLEDYHNRTLTTEAWRNVCKELNPWFEELNDKEKNVYGKTVLKKWRNIRDQWMKTSKKVDSQKKSGAAATTAKYYTYHGQLSFLKKNSACSATESSYTDEHELSADVDDPGIDESNHPALPLPKKKAPTPAEKEGSRKKAKMDVEQAILETLKMDDDPNISFYKGIIPRMSDFTEDEHLQFQCGVLNLIQNIKRSRIYQPPTPTAPRPFMTKRRDHLDSPSTSSYGSRSTSQQWETQSQQPLFPVQRDHEAHFSSGTYLQSPEDSESSIIYD